MRLIAISSKKVNPKQVQKAKSVLKAAEKAQVAEKKAQIKELQGRIDDLNKAARDKLETILKQKDACIKERISLEGEIKKIQAVINSLQTKQEKFDTEFAEVSRKNDDKIKPIQEKIAALVAETGAKVKNQYLPKVETKKNIKKDAAPKQQRLKRGTV